MGFIEATSKIQITDIYSFTVGEEDRISKQEIFPLETGSGIKQSENVAIVTGLLRNAWDADNARRRRLTFEQFISQTQKMRRNMGMSPSVDIYSAWFNTAEGMAQILVDVTTTTIEKREIKNAHKYDFEYYIPAIIQPLFYDSYKRYGLKSNSPIVRGNFADYIKWTNKRGYETFYGDWPMAKVAHHVLQLQAGGDGVIDPKSQVSKSFSDAVSHQFDDPLFLSLFVDQVVYGNPRLSASTVDIMARPLHETRELYKKDREDLLPADQTSSLLHEISRDNDVILDLGCGTGSMTWFYADILKDKKNISLFGLDPLESTVIDGYYVWGKKLDRPFHPIREKVKLYKELLNSKASTTPQFLRGSLLHFDSDSEMFDAGLPFADNSLDVIVAGQVLRYVFSEYSQEITKELERVLKPGGHIIVQESGKAFLIQKAK